MLTADEISTFAEQAAYPFQSPLYSAWHQRWAMDFARLIFDEAVRQLEEEQKK